MFKALWQVLKRLFVPEVKKCCGGCSCDSKVSLTGFKALKKEE